MTGRMIIRRYIPIVCLLILISAFTLTSGQCYGCASLEECTLGIGIDIAAHYITLQGSGNVVLHTNMNYDAVNKESVCVFLNDSQVPEDSLSFREDDRGFLDVHFPKSAIRDALGIADVREIAIFEVTLVGDTIDFTTFCGRQIVTLPPMSE